MFKDLKQCLCCGSNELKQVLNLGNQPLANSYHSEEEILDEYPLALNLCRKCFHLQLTVAVDPDLMFKNYLYVSGTSNTLRNYFEQFANKIKEKHPSARSILDIACNDGTQLDYFAKLGFDTYGIDPAENLYPISSKKGHNIYCDYFNKESIKKINKTFDIILGQNVFAHNSNPLDFLQAAKQLLNDNGAIYIQTSQANMIKNNEFDTIYHEHISFFNLNSMNELCKMAGLNLEESWKENIHGSSYIFKINKGKKSSINFEDEKFLYEEKTYEKYAINCYKIKSNLIEMVEVLNKKNNIIGYGAAAKGNTLLNFTGISLDYIIDDNPMKWTLYTPGSNIKIFSPEILKENSQPTIYIPLAWNFFDEIKNKINIATNKKNLYLKYFPRVEIEI